ncbi:uncharacterized protein LOC143034682 [Oratosquilla oratoria]|uniref:uncharacterized protein LOC143034682 n=1 Tax=Oratosquilla oratoria TaxID=337810 RepID=UPI003F775013
MDASCRLPTSKVWVWSSHRQELIKHKTDGRPASPSASSSTSRRYSLQPGVDKAISKQLIGSKRLVDATMGKLDPAQWESCANAPVTLRDCLKVAVHLYASTNVFERVFLDFVNLNKARKHI